MQRKILAANIGNIVEWYDYILYGYLAPVFAQQFFPVKDHYAAMLAAFATFAAGYITRPLGGIFFGHIGDTHGRGYAIRITFPLIIVCTLLLGLMPTYSEIGILAPILITIIRLIQGFSAGGQSTGTYVYLLEQANQKQRGYFVGLGWSSLTLGILLGSIVCLLVFLIFPKPYSIWVWRIPFLLSALFALLWLPLRKAITNDIVKSQVKRAFPLLNLFRHCSVMLLRAIIITAFPSIAYYMLLIFGITFLNQHGQLSYVASMSITCVGLTLGIVLTPFIGKLTDHIGRRKLMFVGAVGMLVLAVPFFHVLLWGQYWLSLACIMILMLCKDLYAAPGITLINECFPPEIRYSGFALAWNIANGMFGGTVPLISVWLIHNTGSPISPSYYLLLFSLLALFAIYKIRG